MRFICRPLSQIAAESFDRLVGDSFWASRSFLDLWRTMGGRAVAWTLELDGVLVAVVPGVEYGIGPVKRFASLPDGCYGGLFIHPSVQADRATIGWAALESIATHGYAKVSIFDFDATLPRHRDFDEKPCESILVDISGRGWQPPDKKFQSNIRKAAREGVTVVPFNWERHHRSFLELVTTTARRQGQKVRYRTRLFQELARIAARDDRVRWIYCGHAGKPVASQIYFINRGTLQQWQSFYDKSFSFLKANQFMCFTMCREMAERGVRWLNLGASPPGAQGLEYFKTRWGGTSTLYASYTRWDGLGLLARRDAERRENRSLDPLHEGAGKA